MTKIASAPVSYGVFGDLTVEGVITTEQLLMNMASAGYGGSELGPPGFFGSPKEAARKFKNAGLEAVGAYIPLHTQLPGPILDRDLARMRITFEEIVATGGNALAILADEGDESLLLNPRKDPSRMLDAAGWQQLVNVLSSVAEEARTAGIEVSFHPHISTYVELPEEIEHFLADTDIGLTFDVGHVVLAGGDGLALFKKWKDRINHIHVKDVCRSVLEEARAAKREDFDEWWAEVSTRLGTGDAQLEGFIREVVASGYARWLVIEHDSAPLSKENYDKVVSDQSANVDWLKAQILLSQEQA